MSVAVGAPAKLVVRNTGAIAGATAGYQKVLGDMRGVYRDGAAHQRQVDLRGPDHPVYRVEEHRLLEDDGALIIGTSTLLPGRVGQEFAMTRGHLHARANRAELYHCLSGRGVILLETLDGGCEAIELTPGEAAHVPGHWVHRSINVGDEPFVTLFCYPADAGQNYALIEQAGGMAHLVLEDSGRGWTLGANPDHIGYQPPLST